MRTGLRMSSPTPQALRRPTNVSLPVSLVEEARSLDINLSRACGQGIIAAVKAERERQWKQNNKAEIENYNKWIDENGLPLTDLLDELRTRVVIPL
jgi:antitoxin CcdA